MRWSGHYAPLKHHTKQMVMIVVSLHWALRMVQHPEQHFILRYFVNVLRYIDDLLSVNNPYFQKYLVYDGIFFTDGTPAGIYPAYLKGCLEQSGLAVHFLDVFIFYDPARRAVSTTLYSKHGDPKFRLVKFNKYPHIMTKLAVGTKYNVILSELCRYARLVSREKYLITHSALLICRLLDKGYTMRRCLHYIRHVARRSIVPLPKFTFTSERLFVAKLSKRIRTMRRHPGKWGLHLRPFDRYAYLKQRHRRRLRP